MSATTEIIISLWKNSRRRNILILLFWIAFALLFIAQSYTLFLLNNATDGQAFQWWRNLSYAISNYGLWAILTPAVLALADKYPLTGPNSYRNFWRHAGLSISIALAQRFVALYGAYLLQNGFALHVLVEAVDETLGVRHVVVGTAINSILVYWILIAVFMLAQALSRSHEEQLQTSVIREQLTAARLDALRMQLQPHFLFNTLHAISTLVDDDAPAARRMIVRLSELLRKVLEHRSAQQIPLREEIALLEAYLAIEQERFADRLTCVIEIESALLDQPVPTLFLQPLVENSIKHGIAPYARAGSIRVEGRRSNSSVVFQITDSGEFPSATRSDEPGYGIGMESIKKRLEHLYDGTYTFEMKAAVSGGCLVEIKFPAIGNGKSS